MEGDRYVPDGGLFASYVTPPPPPRPPTPPPRPPAPPPPEPPKFDATKHTYVAAITQDVRGKVEACLKVRPTGEELVLAKGETFKIGEVEGTLVWIGDRKIIVEIDGEQSLVGPYESLREGLPLFE